jgi:hypothetical protein
VLGRSWENPPFGGVCGTLSGRFGAEGRQRRERHLSCKELVHFPAWFRRPFPRFPRLFPFGIFLIVIVPGAHDFSYLAAGNLRT